MNKQIGCGSHGTVLLTGNNTNTTIRQALLQSFCGHEAARVAIPAHQQEYRGFQGLESLWCELITIDTLQFPQDGVGGSKPYRPV